MYKQGATNATGANTTNKGILCYLEQYDKVQPTTPMEQYYKAVVTNATGARLQAVVTNATGANTTKQEQLTQLQRTRQGEEQLTQLELKHDKGRSN